MAEVEETLKRIQSHKGVIGQMVIDNDGIAIRTTFSREKTNQLTGLYHQFVSSVRSSVKDVDPYDDVNFIRLHTKKHEIMIAPDKEYMLLVIQDSAEK